MNLESKFRGALLGTAVGDSLGRTLEGTPILEPEKIEEIVAKYRELRYTDDTQMMIGVAESLVEKGGFDGKHMAQRFVENYDPARGYGPGSSRVIRAIESGESWNVPAQEIFGGSGSYGNGSSMRIAPVGVLYHDDMEKLREIAHTSSRITHTHELALEGAAFQAYAVALATSSNPSSRLSVVGFLKKLGMFTFGEVYTGKLQAIGDTLSGGASRMEVVRRLGNGIEAFNSVPTAIYSFLSHSGSFERAVLYAVGLGGDADTIGAMTGAIGGAFHGAEAIPTSWMEKLEGLERIERLGDMLFDVYRNF
ncbi:MAG: ADP-ribosylglycohydrolase family protein [Candidatus Hadarchaeota archaeon]|nr:ADP-ribosylglycohydrolase family protein [Candidatus Hadarchaeota archaeon]